MPLKQTDHGTMRIRKKNRKKERKETKCDLCVRAPLKTAPVCVYGGLSVYSTVAWCFGVYILLGISRCVLYSTVGRLQVDVETLSLLMADDGVTGQSGVYFSRLLL